MPQRPRKLPVSPLDCCSIYAYAYGELMSKNDRMRPAVKPANCTKPRGKNTTSLVGAPPAAPAVSNPPTRYDRNVPYSVWVRRSTLMAERVRKPSWLVSVRVNWLPGALRPIGIPPDSFQRTSSRMKEAIFKHVSVPGTYQK